MKRATTNAVLGSLCAIACASPVFADGNRYGRDRQYHSEISVSDAYLETSYGGAVGHRHRGRYRTLMVDVRTLREYASGHPENAYNVPYPNIYRSGDQDPQVFYDEVYDLVNGDLDRPIVLLCRTGSRSIDAGNILADPENTVGDPRRSAVSGLPFTNVRNIWEGFVGLYRYGFVNVPGQGLVPDPTAPLDLNNDGVINENMADVHVETRDYNPDMDGWRNFAALPWTTDIRRHRAYFRDPSLYHALNLTPVQ
jgi:rhodanese-related sulfurtransferase